MLKNSLGQRVELIHLVLPGKNKQIVISSCPVNTQLFIQCKAAAELIMGNPPKDTIQAWRQLY